MDQQIEMTLNSAEEIRRKADDARLKRKWYVALPLAYFLAVMVPFPLRIVLPELTYDVIFYGAIAVFCVVQAIQAGRRFSKRGYRLLAVFLLCSLLSGWQIFDLLVLRTGEPSAWDFGKGGLSQYLTEDEGLAWYNLRFPNKEIMCHVLYERYWGNELIAITVRINRDATWYACGG